MKFKTVTDLHKFAKSFSEKLQQFQVKPEKQDIHQTTINKIESLIKSWEKISLLEISKREHELLASGSKTLFGTMGAFFRSVSGESAYTIISAYRGRLEGLWDIQMGHHILVSDSPVFWGHAYYIKEGHFQETQPTPLERLAFDAFGMKLTIDKEYSCRVLGN